MKISVIIPCYNVENWIDRCLESIVCQTIGLKDLEIICVDDCSTDQTLTKLKKWEERYSDSLMLIKLDENGRQGTARNVGLTYATGEWITFVDSDDWVEKDYLERMLEVCRDADYDVICCDSIRDSSKELHYLESESRKNGRDSFAFEISTEENRKQLIHLQSMRLSAWGKLIRRDLLLKYNIFFPENLAYEDIFWGQLLHLYATNIYVLEERLYHYFINEGSTVLQSATSYHVDMLTIQSLFYQEMIKRNLYDFYRDELEFEYIYTGMLAFLKVIALRFEEPPYSLFLLLQNFTKEHYPALKENPYVMKGELSEMHYELLQMMYMPLRKADFFHLMESLKKIGI